MGQKFCTACGAALTEGLRFCEHCGASLPPEISAQTLQPAGVAGEISGIPPVTALPQGGKSISSVMVIAAVFIFLVIAAGASLFILPSLSGTGVPDGLFPGSVTTPPTAVPVITISLPPSPQTTVIPTQKPDPYPGALRLTDRFSFGSGTIASEAAVYRFWINDTYEWHNDNDNRYYVEKPRKGNKFLFVFVHMQNNGDYRVWFPPAGNIIVSNNGATYTEDQNHYKPDKLSDKDATPVEVREVMYYQKLNGDEYAEDFGFSHGTELAYLYPGKSNAVDGYIVYQVPESLVPEETYVLISFNARDQGIWKLG